MAKQKGLIKIKGTMGDMTFYKTEDGYLVKEKSEITREKILNDPAFQRTRENISEFGRAGKASKLFRNAIRVLLQNAQDRRSTSRLTKEMMRVVKADATSARGQRNVIDGETGLLKSFEFNSDALLASTLYAPYTAVINRVAGSLVVDIPSFNPAAMLVAPAGATHYKIVSAAVEIDFELEIFNTLVDETAFLLLNNVNTAAVNMQHAMPANSTHPLFILLGIQFSQEVNGIHYPLLNGAFNALCIVTAEGV